MVSPLTPTFLSLLYTRVTLEGTQEFMSFAALLTICIVEGVFKWCQNPKFGEMKWRRPTVAKRWLCKNEYHIKLLKAPKTGALKSLTRSLVYIWTFTFLLYIWNILFLRVLINAGLFWCSTHSTLSISLSQHS
jgi:hypothetical protein